MRFGDAFEYAKIGFYIYREGEPDEFYTVREDDFSYYFEKVHETKNNKEYVEKLLSVSVYDMLKNDWNITKTYRK